MYEGGTCSRWQTVSMRKIAFYLLLVTTLCIDACSTVHQTSAQHEATVKELVLDTFNLELQGIRWKELMDSTLPRQYYSRFIWKPDVEPGWDVLTISESVTVQDVHHVASRSWDELMANGDIEERITSGYDATVAFKNLYQLTREGYQRSTDDHIRLFLVERDGIYVITNRLHSPHFGVRAANELLHTSSYSSTVFEPLRSAIRQRLDEKR